MATKREEPGSIRDRNSLELVEMLKKVDAAIHRAQRPGGDANLEEAQQIISHILREVA